MLLQFQRVKIIIIFPFLMFAVEGAEVEFSKGDAVGPLATLFDAEGPLPILIVTDDT